MHKKTILLIVVVLSVLFLQSSVLAGIEDEPEDVTVITSTPVNDNTQLKMFYQDGILHPTPKPTISLLPQQTPVPDNNRKAEKIKKYYRDYYFVIEESLRVLEYNAEDYNHAVCSGDKSEMKRLREKLNIAVLDADVLMEKLGLYNDLNLWKIYYGYIQDADCGLDRGLIAETKGAMDRLHRQTEKLGLWVPSTGESEYMVRNANCAQGLYTAPNGVCLSENGITSTKYYHSNGYAVECVWPGRCDRVNIKQMNRCDWIDCN